MDLLFLISANNPEVIEVNKMAKVFMQMGAFSEETDSSKINTTTIHDFMDEVLKSRDITKEQFIALAQHSRFWADKIKAYERAIELAGENDLGFRIKVLHNINSMPNAGKDAVDAIRRIFQSSPILSQPKGFWEAMRIVGLCAELSVGRPGSDLGQELSIPAMKKALEIAEEKTLTSTGSFPSASPSATQAREREIADLNKLYKDS